MRKFRICCIRKNINKYREKHNLLKYWMSFSPGAFSEKCYWVLKHFFFHFTTNCHKNFYTLNCDINHLGNCTNIFDIIMECSLAFFTQKAFQNSTIVQRRCIQHL